MKCMGLSKYIAIMRDERITGALLVQLTESMLEKNLKISSRYHQFQIMDLIQGRVDAFALLTESKSRHPF